MKRPLAWLMTLAIVFQVGARWAGGSGDRPGAGPRGLGVTRMVEAERAEAMTVAAVSIEFPLAPPMTYVRSRGVWRCIEASAAPARGDLIAALASGLLGARGRIRGTPDIPVPSYGLSPPRAVIRLHGAGVVREEDRDVLVSYDIGASHRPGGGSPRYFLRESGTSAIFEVPIDLADALRPTAREGLPPLLDQRFLIDPWKGPACDFQRMRIEGPGMDFVLERKPATPAAPGEPDWRWVLQRQDGSATDVLFLRAESFGGFLRRMVWTDLIEPGRLPELGFERPAMRITAWTLLAEERVLEFGGSAPFGGQYVLHEAARVLGTIDAAHRAALQLGPETFTDREQPIPWEGFFRQ